MSLVFVSLGVAACAAILLFIFVKERYSIARAGYLRQQSRMFKAVVIADSISPAGARVTTIEWTYPRFIHSEVMTHRIARSAMSSRALPVMTVWKQVLFNPAGPVQWGKSSRSMQAETRLRGWRKRLARWLWYVSRYPILMTVWCMVKLKVHKEIANRLLEPWQWMTLVMTASSASWNNIWRLRCPPDAQPEMQYIAQLARAAYFSSKPVKREWHLPFITQYELWYHEVYLNTVAVNVPTELLQMSAARCARTSYGNNAKRYTKEEDIKLFSRLVSSDPPHTNPLEHACIAHWDVNYRSGPLSGWVQYRQMVDPHWSTFFPKESVRAPEPNRNPHRSEQCGICTGEGRHQPDDSLAGSNP